MHQPKKNLILNVHFGPAVFVPTQKTSWHFWHDTWEHLAVAKGYFIKLRDLMERPWTEARYSFTHTMRFVFLRKAMEWLIWTKKIHPPFTVGKQRKKNNLRFNASVFFEKMHNTMAGPNVELMTISWHRSFDPPPQMMQFFNNLCNTLTSQNHNLCIKTLYYNTPPLWIPALTLTVKSPWK